MKISITRLLETSKYIATKAGAELADMIVQLAEFMDQGVRALRNGLTFRDNHDCEIKSMTLRDGIPATIGLTKVVTGALPIRTLSSTYAVASFLWYYDSNSKLTVKATFTPTPADPVTVEAIFLY